MFTLWGDKQKFCDGLTRRSFLQIGAFGAGLTLADMLRAQANSQDAPTSSKSAIMIYLPGGPSHLDMYDLKPDAPAEFRGEFRPIATNVTGVQICEHFPLQARMWDKLACVRSIGNLAEEHSDSLVMTGHSERDNRTANHPSFGAVVSRLRGGRNGNVPPFISLRGMTPGTEPGFLGIAHRPFTTSDEGLNNLRPNPQVSGERLQRRRNLLESFDGVRRELDTRGEIAGLDAFNQCAIGMITSGNVRTALDLTRENQAVRQRYQGVEQFLTALRLVQAGVGCVTLSNGGWDTHGQNFQTLRRQLPLVDKGVANLIGDLHERGLARDVVTVMWGEFGRTPFVNSAAGRDHWTPAMSCLIAGGGLRVGQAVGSTTRRGERPLEARCTVGRILSTIYQSVGIDPTQYVQDTTGRPRHILDDRDPVRELLS